MNQKRLNELKALAEKASPGPWKVEWDWNHDREPAMMYKGWGTGPDCLGDSFKEMQVAAMNDAHFIAAARSAVPELIAEIGRLRAWQLRAAETAYQEQVVDTGMEASWIGTDREYADKQDWIEQYIQEGGDE